MSQIKDIQEIPLIKAKEIVQNGNAWENFLNNACYTNKYSFQNQLLIYAQKSNVTAVASMDLWNNRFNRWVNKGARGIQIVDDDVYPPKVRYVFDISDTHPTKYTVQDVKLWQFDKNIHEPVLTILEQKNQFTNDPQLTIEERIAKYVQKNIDTDSLIEKMEPFLKQNLNLQMKESLQDLEVRSVTYMTMKRMGLDPVSYFKEKNQVNPFENIQYFYSDSTRAIALLNVLATETMDHYTNISKELSRNIQDYEKNLKNPEKTLQETQGPSYTMGNKEKRLRNENKAISGDSNERGVTKNGSSEIRRERLLSRERKLHSGSEGDELREMGRNIPTTGGRPNSEHEDGNSGGKTDWEVRKPSENVLERTQQNSLQQSNNTRETVDPSSRYQRASEQNDGNNDKTNDGVIRNNGGTESQRSDPMDKRSEQHSGNVRGSNLQGTGLRINENKGEQLSLFTDDNDTSEDIQNEAVENNFTAFSITQKEIDSVLVKGSGFENGKSRIVNFFMTSPTINNAVDFLKNEYGIGGWGGYLNVMYDSKGIKISKPNAEMTIKWPQVAKRIKELIENNQYLTPKEINEQVEKNNVAAIDNVSDIQPVQEKHNYHITDDKLGNGGDKTKFAWNIDAIRTLKKIENENRLASPEEQEILAKYVGWGGLANAFDENNTTWSKEYAELKSVLTEDEYISARSSTLNAHYTSPTIIKAMYQALDDMGFKTGNILEPSCGIGNFIGLIPENMKESNIYGVELDDLTGRIAKQLYQNANITIDGYENTNHPDSFFDVAIGNVPFGQYKVADKRYDKQNFLIHDYFFAKTLDKVRPGGVIAFITSKGTLDKESESVRKYIAQRADLLGAIRLPNNAFKSNAGTEVTSDIIFLQKRDRISDVDANWINLGTNENGIRMNQYFIDHPEMILGHMEMRSTQFGREESTCVPFENVDLKEQLSMAIKNVQGQYEDYDFSLDNNIEQYNTLPADPSVHNFSYTIVDGDVYYRENSRMLKQELKPENKERLKALIILRDTVREVIDYQANDYDNETIKKSQQKLNNEYDNFVKKYGRINNKNNLKAFDGDSSYALLASLEIVDSDNNFVRKADIFSKRTIRKHVVVSHVDTPSEALALSLSEKAKIDLAYMNKLTGIEEKEIIKQLEGIIFLNPETKEFETNDEYLSGNVREKLKVANRKKNELEQVLSNLEIEYPVNADDVQITKDSIHSLDINIKFLEKVIPKELSASEITVRLGATWIPQRYIEEFMFETFKTPNYNKFSMEVNYSPYTANWNIKGKSVDNDNILATSTYGTSRINAYKILEDTLNLKDVRVMDKITDEYGNEKSVLNKKETMLARQKQDLIKQTFSDWIWKDPIRRDKLTKMYNEKFNSIRPREYDGSHINFPGMNPLIDLREHQRNAVAHVLYGGNTLLAHVVGAGKTYEMIAAAMESKRLGLSQKSLFVVPNHLTKQWGTEFLQLYPSANILVATKKDFQPNNRKKFCSRIATGDYDAVIIGHSQFEKIPLSVEYQKEFMNQQIEEIVNGIAELKEKNGDKFSIKQLEKTKKSLDVKLKKLNDQSRKDDVVTFEQLGVDRLFVDEAHSYKNLFLYTKMRNVAGIGQSEAKKSTDMFMKCRYMDELTNGKGIIFATGTPISNSMTELYTMQRYLQYSELKEKGLENFDAWASTFGETVTAIELAPEGTGYRSKTRFSKFYNLPELMNMFKEIADIKTADMLKLPVPEAKFTTVVVKPSEHQKNMVKSLSERAELVRNNAVSPSKDNMLKITNDGRKLALDQRLINENLPDDNEGKVSICAQNAYDIWYETMDKHSTQLIFCDLSTPKGDGSFNVYDDIKNKLIEKGIPSEEIAFIHDAKNEKQKDELFAKVKTGEIRILLGSTQKMGAGTNVQDKLIAIHDLDCPWKPSDLEQRMGRIVRQGNENKEVRILRYVTENTFDAYLYQLVENKQKFISQIMTSKSPARSAEDVDESALSYAEIKALATGNPLIKEKMDLDIQVSKLKMLKSSYLSQKYILEDKVLKKYPKQISKFKEEISGYEKDIEFLSKNNNKTGEFSFMEIKGRVYTDKEEAGKALLESCKTIGNSLSQEIGSYRGFKMILNYDVFNNEFNVDLRNAMSHRTILGNDVYGNITRLDNTLDNMPKRYENKQELLLNTQNQLENAKLELNSPFPQEQELKDKQQRLSELENLLDLEKEPSPTHDNSVMKDEKNDIAIKETDLDLSNQKESDSLNKNKNERASFYFRQLGLQR